jgi:hypothetical protein
VARRSLVAKGVAGDGRARAAEEQIGAIRAHRRVREAVHVGATADDVVLAEVAEDDVVAAVALDVVVTVGRGVARGAESE